MQNHHCNAAPPALLIEGQLANCPPVTHFAVLKTTDLMLPSQMHLQEGVDAIHDVMRHVETYDVTTHRPRQHPHVPDITRNPSCFSWKFGLLTCYCCL